MVQQTFHDQDPTIKTTLYSYHPFFILPNNGSVMAIEDSGCDTEGNSWHREDDWWNCDSAEISHREVEVVQIEDLFPKSDKEIFIKFPKHGFINKARRSFDKDNGSNIGNHYTEYHVPHYYNQRHISYNCSICNAFLSQQEEFWFEETFDIGPFYCTDCVKVVEFSDLV